MNKGQHLAMLCFAAMADAALYSGVRRGPSGGSYPKPPESPEHKALRQKRKLAKKNKKSRKRK